MTAYFLWGYGIILRGYPGDTKGSAAIYGNYIHVSGWADAIGFEDLSNDEGFGPSFCTSVIGNQIVMDDNFMGGGVYGYAASDILVAFNRMSGSAYAGVYQSIWGDPGSGWLIIFNDFEDFDTSWTTPPELGADIVLGVGSSNCYVLGRATTSVIDDGTDNTVHLF